MKKLFIDNEVNVSEGHQAEIKLSLKNDSKYISDNSIHKVDKSRWQEAQQYERKTWMVLCGGSWDDRNFDHFQKFDNYSKLREVTTPIKKVIELGCGPFTNLRTLYNLLPDLEEVHLLDPLLEDYLNHNYCSYKNRNFLNFKTFVHSCPIEEFEITEKYDLVLMNNVLEHCFDINLIFDKIDNMLETNGIFIFHDVYFPEEIVLESTLTIYDSGHPLKLSKNFMEKYLEKFEAIFVKDTDADFGRGYKYFIGRKK